MTGFLAALGGLALFWKILLVVGGILLLIVIIWAATRSPRPAPRPMPPPAPDRDKDSGAADHRKKEQLANQYCDLSEEIARQKADEAYNDLFFRYARIYQVLLGLERARITDEALLDELRIELENAGIARQLSDQGFLFQPPVPQVNRAAELRDCMALDLQDLQQELEKQERMLRHYQNITHYKSWLQQTGQPLYVLAQAVRAGDAGLCRRKIAAIRAALEGQGCCPLFADHPAVAASTQLQVDFLDDGPNAVELPGLYTRGKDGNYVLVGKCVGTRRVSA